MTSRAKVLVIEDNPENRYLVSFLLVARGYEVIVADSGPAGLDLAIQAVPDLILLDIQLPGMDGHAVSRALKADPRTCAIPIVAVTSYAMVGDREKCIAAGAAGYLEKPIDPDTFVDDVAKFIPQGTGTHRP